MYKRYGDRVAFLGIYVREAHPTDGWPLPSNQKAGIALSSADRPRRTVRRGQEMLHAPEDDHPPASSMNWMTGSATPTAVCRTGST